MNHPESCTDPTCDLVYADHLLSIFVSAHATPTRRPDVVRTDRTEAGWQKDHAAYRRLRKAGVQPRTIDGTAQIEAKL